MLNFDFLFLIQNFFNLQRSQNILISQFFTLKSIDIHKIWNLKMAPLRTFLISAKKIFNQSMTQEISSLKKKTRFLIFPNSIFAKIWGLILLIVLLYVTFMLTFEAAFLESPSKIYNILEFVVTGVYFLDILINFNKVVLLHKKKLLLTRRKDIAKHYLKGWFFIDLLAFFPFFLFTNDFQFGFTASIKALQLARFFNLLRLLRIVKTFKHLSANDSTLNKTISRRPARYRNSVGRLSSHLMMIMVFCHLFACVFYVVPLKYSPDKNWVIYRGLLEMDSFDKYLNSMHWMIETVITVGYGENNIRYIHSSDLQSNIIILYNYGNGFYISEYISTFYKFVSKAYNNDRYCICIFSKHYKINFRIKNDSTVDIFISTIELFSTFNGLSLYTCTEY